MRCIVGTGSGVEREDTGPICSQALELLGLCLDEQTLPPKAVLDEERICLARAIKATDLEEAACTAGGR